MKSLAIVGATGLVGQKVLEILQEEKLYEEFEISMFVSDKSVGKVIVLGDRHYLLRQLNEKVLECKFDFAIFLTSEDISRVWVPAMASTGTVVVDNSSAFRLQNNIPLIVPEINFNILKNSDKIISNPNCSTIQLVIVLDRLLKISKIKSVVVSSYQSVSGAGREALLDLKERKNRYFSCDIQDNIIPYIGGFDEFGSCSEENKIINETKKILGVNYDIFATSVRIPTSYCHGESVFIEFEDNVSLNEIKSALQTRYIRQGDLFYLSDCVNSNLTYVCRLRKCGDRQAQMFIIADNLRRGASFNAVEILKRITKIHSR